MIVGLIPDPELGMVSRLPEGLGHPQQQGMVPWLHVGRKKGETLMVRNGNLTPNPALELGKSLGVQRDWSQLHQGWHALKGPVVSVRTYRSTI